jgi:hypothetical protein
MLPEGLPPVLLRPPEVGRLRPEALPNPYALVPYTPPQQVLQQVLHAANDPGDWRGQQQQVRQLLRQLRGNRPDLHFDNELRLPGAHPEMLRATRAHNGQRGALRMSQAGGGGGLTGLCPAHLL